MKGWETFGLAAVAVVLLGTPAAVFAGQQYLNAPAHTYTLVGYAVEDGGWTPKEIAVHQGEHVHLRVTSGDVSHGLMVPGLNINVPEIYPGKYTTVDFTPKTAGRYPFMCTVLCSPRHGQMQGAIVVLPAEGAEAPAGVTAGAAPQSEGASGAGQAAASPAGSPRPAASSSAPAAASAAAGPVGSSGPSVSAQPKAAAPQSTSSSASPSAAASPKSSPSAAPSSGSVSAAEIAA
ncbi:MAG: cupredoxin domain-containing protein, partial [Chloroflexota bacterium]|nr:cupredoxin domain-containing protein [Chloroflexota bacterium]